MTTALSPRGSAIFLALWLGLLLTELQLFFVFDWNHGLARAALLCAVTVTVVVLHGMKDRLVLPAANSRLRCLVWALISAAATFHLGLGLNSARRTASTGDIPLDQGQNNYNAIQLLRSHSNPYSTSAMLDLVEFDNSVEQIRHHPECGSVSGFQAASIHDSWGRFEPVVLTNTLREIQSQIVCPEFRLRFESLGMKYGPVLIAGYVPFVLTFGKAGVFVAHTVYFALLLLFVTQLMRRPGRFDFWGATVAFTILLVPIHLRHNTLANSASDLLPTLVALSAVAIATAKPRCAAALLGMSVGAKMLPGAAFAPLAVIGGWRSMAWFVVASAATYLPFLIWEPRGIWNNIVLFNLIRDADSTSWRYYVPQAAQLPFLAMLLVVFCALWFWTLRRRSEGSDRWLGCVLSIIVVLLVGKAFHNNYLVWLIPTLAIYASTCVIGMRRAADDWAPGPRSG
jgi:hypothetical protein